MSVAFKVVIPARFASTRLPGKPLLPIAGKPMIQHVWERARESGAAEVVVATDDERILQVVQAFGGDAHMTASHHASGTDRLAEVASARGWASDVVVVNLQGDEPLMSGELVASMARALAQHPEAGISTLAAAISNPEDIFNPNVVKVVLDQRQFALYFSRAPIPWVRDQYADQGQRNKLPSQIPVLRHFGLYGYRVASLLQLSRTPVAALEAAESLEQLRALTLGTRIFVEITKEGFARGVDTHDDLLFVDELLSGRAS